MPVAARERGVLTAVPVVTGMVRVTGAAPWCAWLRVMPRVSLW